MQEEADRIKKYMQVVLEHIAFNYEEYNKFDDIVAIPFTHLADRLEAKDKNPNRSELIINRDEAGKVANEILKFLHKEKDFKFELKNKEALEGADYNSPKDIHYKVECKKEDLVDYIQKTFDEYGKGERVKEKEEIQNKLKNVLEEEDLKHKDVIVAILKEDPRRKIVFQYQNEKIDINTRRRPHFIYNITRLLLGLDTIIEKPQEAESRLFIEDWPGYTKEKYKVGNWVEFSAFHDLIKGKYYTVKDEQDKYTTKQFYDAVHGKNKNSKEKFGFKLFNRDVDDEKLSLNVNNLIQKDGNLIFLKI
ncbi:MAG: hypothetical protein ABEJ24_03965 [Candidatus Magasanikbacteria bacterium]